MLNDPEFSGQLNVRYLLDDFGVTYSFNYVGEQLFSRLNRTGDIHEIDQLKDFVTVNASTYFDVDKQFRLTFSVTNLLNRRGETYYGAVIPATYTTPALGTDLLGRRFDVSARVRF